MVFFRSSEQHSSFWLQNITITNLSPGGLKGLLQLQQNMGCWYHAARLWADGDVAMA
jgi:hypothetical protein